MSTNISWTHETQNFWTGCTKCAPECQFCYIYREVRKQSDWESLRDSQSRCNIQPEPKAPKRQPWNFVYLTKTWNNPHKWQQKLVEEMTALNRPPGYAVNPDLPNNGRPEVRNPKLRCIRVFTNSLADFFDAAADNKRVVPASCGAAKMAEKQHRGPAQRCGSLKWRDCSWQVIRDTPHCVWLILTKRPENILSRLPKDWGHGWPNVWLGVSVGCRLTLKKLDSLRKVPVHPQAVRFLSAEPLLEDISQDINLDGIGWVIAGGESGEGKMTKYDPAADWKTPLKDLEARGHRWMSPSWAKNLQRLCAEKKIPYFFKQVSGTRQGLVPDALGRIYHEYPDPPYGEWMDEKVWEEITGKKVRGNEP